MEFAEKKAAYNKLMGETHLEDDFTLLKVKNPASYLVDSPVVDKKKMQSDIVWDLLDHATVDEILKNRGVKVKTVAPKKKPPVKKPQPVAQKKKRRRR